MPSLRACLNFEKFPISSMRRKVQIMRSRFLLSFLCSAILGVSAPVFSSSAEASQARPAGDGISKYSKCWQATRSPARGLHSNHWLVPRSIALQGVGSYEESGVGLLKNYIRVKGNHYYKWYQLQKVLNACRRADVLRWIKANTSSARTMSDYLYLGLSWKVALKTDTPTELLGSWCKAIPSKQKESIANGFPGDVFNPLIACK